MMATDITTESRVTISTVLLIKYRNFYLSANATEVHRTIPFPISTKPIELELTVPVSGAIKVPEGRVTGRLDTVEMVLILFILCLWAFVIRIFLNKWGESMSGLAKSKYFMPGGYYVLSFIIVFFPVLQNQL